MINTSPWDDIDDTLSYTCCAECEYYDRHKCHGRDHLSAVYDMLSGKIALDPKDLYWHLEEVASVLDYEMPSDDLIALTK